MQETDTPETPGQSRPLDGVFVAAFLAVSLVSMLASLGFLYLELFLPYGYDVAWRHIVMFLLFGIAAATSGNAAFYLYFSRTWAPWRIAIVVAVMLVVDTAYCWVQYAGYDNFEFGMGEELRSMILWSTVLACLNFFAATIAVLGVLRFGFGWRLRLEGQPDRRPQLAIWQMLAFTMLAGLVFAGVRVQMSFELEGFSFVEMNLWPLAVGVVVATIFQSTAIWSWLRIERFFIALLVACIPLLLLTIAAIVISLFQSAPLVESLIGAMTVIGMAIGLTAALAAPLIVLRVNGRRVSAGASAVEEKQADELSRSSGRRD